MSRGIYTERNLSTPRPMDCDLVEMDSQLIPAMMSAIAGRMGPSHWASPEAWVEGYSRLSRQGAAMLMGCSENIIREIRDARGSTPPGAPTDLESYPVGTFPGGSLATVERLLYNTPDTAAELLTQIRDILVQQQQTDGESLEALGQIVLLLGV